jgi:flagellar motor component MotA
MQNIISVAILAVGFVLALCGAWLLWGPLSLLVVVGGALFAFGLVSID